MPFLFALVIVPLFFFLPGYLTSRILFRNPAAFSAGERLFIPIAASICLTTWLALLLAEFGAFSLWNVSIGVVVLCALMYLFARKKFSAWSLRGGKPDWIFLATFALAVFLFARPAEYVLGNYDAGIYVNTGAVIARTGGIVSRDALLPTLDAALGKQLLWDLPNPFLLQNQTRLPGFFIANAEQGLVTPQFLHFYPAWLAIWNVVLGLKLGLYATPLLGLAASVAFYFLVKTIYSKNLARLAFFLLVLTVPQFWFARYPVAEMMMQLLLLLGMYALLQMNRRGGNEIGMALLAGVGLGQVFLTRADALLLLAPLAIAGAIVFFGRHWRREYWFFMCAFALVALHALAHLVIFSPSYLYFQFAHVLRMRNIDQLLPGGLPTANELATRAEYLALLIGFILLAALVLKIADALIQRARKRWGDRAHSFAHSHQTHLRALGALLLVSIFLYAYFIAPAPQTLLAYVGGITPLDSSANLVKLGWYLSPFGIVLAMAGAVIVLLRDLNRHNAIFFGTAALYAVFYLDELYSNPHYIYTTRHYIPLALPLFILLAARALEWLWNLRGASPWNRVARAASAALFVLWMFYNLYAMGIVDPCGRQQCSAGAGTENSFVVRVPFAQNSTQLGGIRSEPFEKAIAGFSELGGAFSQIESLAQTIPPNAIVLMMAAPRDQPALIATPLHFIFGRDVFVVTANAPDGELLAQAIEQWRAQGREVILAFGTNGGRVAIPSVALEPFGDFDLDVPQWTFAYDVMPRVPWRVNLSYALFRATLRATPENYPFVLDFGGNDFPYLVNGFLERAPEEKTRWIGGLLAEHRDLADAKTVSGIVRVPIPTHSTRDLKLTLRARAPRDNVLLQIKTQNRVLGTLTLSQKMETFEIPLPATNIKERAEGFFIEFVSETTLDGKGRALGAELEMLQVQSVK